MTVGSLSSVACASISASSACVFGDGGHRAVSRVEQLVVAGEIGRGPLSGSEPVVQPGQRAGLAALSAAGEDLHRAAVERAGRQRAADGELDLRGGQLAAEQQHVDHLPGRL